MHEVGYDVTEEAATRAFCAQLLTGDTTDNIVGLPKVGPAKAEKVLHGLETYDDMMQAIAAEYQVRAPVEDWHDYMTEMGQLLWIRREPDQMWQPPSEEELGMAWDMTEEELTL